MIYYFKFQIFDLFGYDDLFYLNFVAAEEPSLLAAAMRTNLAVRDGGIVTSATVAMRHGRDGLYLQFTTTEHLFFICCPAPAIRQIVRDDGRYLADVHYDSGYVLNVVLVCRFLNIPNNIEYYP